MFDISRREPRQLGSAGKFVDSKTGESIGVVRSVRCNSDGTCMSLLADRKAGAYLRTPDERIHVYNLDLAAISRWVEDGWRRGRRERRGRRGWGERRSGRAEVGGGVGVEWWN
jgi:hypothetical protein